MAYQLTEQTWLQRETERIKGVLLQYMQHGVAYDGAAMKDRCRRLGLDYTDAEFLQLRDALIAEGVIEQV